MHGIWEKFPHQPTRLDVAGIYPLGITSRCTLVLVSARENSVTLVRLFTLGWGRDERRLILSSCLLPILWISQPCDPGELGEVPGTPTLCIFSDLRTRWNGLTPSFIISPLEGASWHCVMCVKTLPWLRLPRWEEPQIWRRKRSSPPRLIYV